MGPTGVPSCRSVRPRLLRAQRARGRESPGRAVAGPSGRPGRHAVRGRLSPPAMVVVGLAVVAATAVVMAPGVAAAAGSPGVTASSAMTAVAGGPGPLPRGARALGAVPATRVLSAEVALRPADPAALEAFDAAVTTPSSPLYRHFLARDQFAARFGP